MSPGLFEPSDQRLIAAANRGDRDAMETLYYRYRDWVVALAYRFCRNREDALDVMQQAFIYLFSKFPGFELCCQMKSFLYPVVKNLAVDQLRKRDRLVAWSDAQTDVVAPVSRDARAGRQNVAELVARLPEQQREVVLMRFADGLSLSEIAEALEIPLGTVKSRLHNALATLRESLQREI
jgi:RNA polymerase sigma-70 factor (ECF subfamily)